MVVAMAQRMPKESSCPVCYVVGWYLGKDQVLFVIDKSMFTRTTIEYSVNVDDVSNMQESGRWDAGIT